MRSPERRRWLYSEELLQVVNLSDRPTPAGTAPTEPGRPRPSDTPHDPRATDQKEGRRDLRHAHYFKL